jgi:predicted 3-demethylubiquinone-9 3-methyltransferase (glyoxalase superfamily)
MTNPITPCLWCKDDALAKAQYYCNIFPNSRILSEHPVMVTFELNGNRFQALNGGVAFEYNESISFTINCEDQAEVDHYWDTFIKVMVAKPKNVPGVKTSGECGGKSSPKD